MNWSAKLQFGPVPTPDGKPLVTLADARKYILKMPETEATLRAAGELLKAAEHGGPFLHFARIAVYRAIHGDAPAPKRKETWREKRKKARRPG